MIKIYKKLTDEQIKRGVVFCSCLSESRTEQQDDIKHEIFNFDNSNLEEIRRLKDDKFFNASHWNFNIIRR